MKSGIPWSVKGIEPEVREAAKDAARRSGLTLGEWLNNAIVEQAEARAGQKSREMHPLVRDRFSRIAEELAMMTAERPQEKEGRPFRPPPQADMTLEAVLERVENQERYLTEALASINERLKAVNAQIARQAEQAADSTGAAENYASLEAAVRNIVGHLDVSQRRTQETITTLQDQVRRLGDRSGEEASSERVSQIESHLDGIYERLERHEQDSQMLQAVQSQVREISEQLGALKSLPDSLVERAKVGAAGSLRPEIKVLEGTLQSLAASVETSLAQLSGLNRDVDRLRNDVSAMKADMGAFAYHIEGGAGDQASQSEVKLLQSSLEKLSARFEELPIIAIERRLSDMTRRISEIEIRGRALPQMNEVARKMQELEDRLAERSPSAADEVLDQMFEQMRVFDGRLAGAEEKLHSLHNIERSISQIFQALEDNRADVQEMAEAAARRVASELHKNPTPEEAQQPLLAALEQALDGLRQESRQSEQQTQETFDALHETLEEIINRLSEVENARAPAPAQVQNQGLEPEAPPQRDQARKALLSNESPAATGPDWRNNVNDHLAKAQSEIKADPQLSLERPREAAAAVEDLFSPEDTAPPAKPVAERPESPPAQEDDFIAAARRAAQAAAQGARHSLGRGMQSTGATEQGRMSKGKRVFPLSFFKRPAPVKPRHPKGVNDEVATAADSAKAAPDGNKRRLLLAALLLLAAVSAFAVRSGYKASSAPEPAAQTKTQSLNSGAAADSRSSVSEDATSEAPTPLADAIDSPSVRLAALEGQAEAQFVIAGRYMEGSTVAQNPVEAAKWYRKAAEQGLAPAQYRLGTLYERGIGMAKKTATAIYWYEKAADQGNVKAMHNLGVLLAQSPDADYAAVAHWFMTAAAHGIKDSQYNLAILYERGLGVRQDQAEALFWYLAAAAQGDEEAAKKAETVENSLSPALAQSARERFEGWQPEKAQSDANMVSLALARG